MEPLIVVALLVALVALFGLALRHAPDSRDGPRSKEQDLAAYGVTWADLRGDPAVAVPVPERRGRSRRSLVAAAKEVAGVLARRPTAVRSPR